MKIFFECSQDRNGLNSGGLFWCFSDDFTVCDQSLGSINKQLTLSYDFIWNDYFDLCTVIDRIIELYPIDSETTYRFKGLG